MRKTMLAGVALVAACSTHATVYAIEIGRFNFKQVSVVSPDAARLDISDVTAKLPDAAPRQDGMRAIVVRIEVAASGKELAKSREFAQVLRGRGVSGIQVVINPGTEFAVQAGPGTGGIVPPVGARSGEREWTLVKEFDKGKPKLGGFSFAMEETTRLDMLFFVPKDARPLTLIWIDDTNRRFRVQSLREQ